MANRLNDIFGGLQEKLRSDLLATKTAITHALAKGEASEVNWIQMLSAHIPHRYQVSNGFVIDCEGTQSDYIDVVIYDRQYTPLLYNKDNQRLIPAESVYAVLEVKQDLSKEHIEYAGAKAESVRRLKRTSAAIPYAEGVYKPKPLSPILGGIVAYESSWNPPLGEPLQNALRERSERQRLDLGCGLSHGTFETTYDAKGNMTFICYDADQALISFFIRLLARLQQLATVPAIDYDIYGSVLKKL